MVYFFCRHFFNLYEKFSKLAHLGSLSFGLTHAGYNNSEVGTSAEDLHASIYLITRELVMFACLFDTVAKDKNKLWDLINKIGELKPYYINEYIDQNHSK